MTQSRLEVAVPDREVALTRIQREVATRVVGPVVALEELGQRRLAARELAEHPATLREPQVSEKVQCLVDGVEFLDTPAALAGVAPSDPMAPRPGPIRTTAKPEVRCLAACPGVADLRCQQVGSGDQSPTRRGS